VTQREYIRGAPPYILPTKHCLNDQIKKNEMGGTFSMYRVLVGTPEETRQLGIPGHR